MPMTAECCQWRRQCWCQCQCCSCQQWEWLPWQMVVTIMSMTAQCCWRRWQRQLWRPGHQRWLQQRCQQLCNVVNRGDNNNANSAAINGGNVEADKRWQQWCQWLRTVVNRGDNNDSNATVINRSNNNTKNNGYDNTNAMVIGVVNNDADEQWPGRCQQSCNVINGGDNTDTDTNAVVVSNETTKLTNGDNTDNHDRKTLSMEVMMLMPMEATPTPWPLMEANGITAVSDHLAARSNHHHCHTNLHFCANLRSHQCFHQLLLLQQCKRHLSTKATMMPTRMPWSSTEWLLYLSSPHCYVECKMLTGRSSWGLWYHWTVVRQERPHCLTDVSCL